MWRSEKYDKTAVVEDTLNPVWMQTLYSPVKILVDDKIDERNTPQSLTYAPDIVLTGALCFQKMIVLAVFTMKYIYIHVQILHLFNLFSLVYSFFFFSTFFFFGKHTVYNRDNEGKEDFIGRTNFPTVLALSNGVPQEMDYWPGENTMNKKVDPQNLKRPIWLQLRAGKKF